jgi:hypothetical protein
MSQSLDVVNMVPVHSSIFFFLGVHSLMGYVLVRFLMFPLYVLGVYRRHNSDFLGNCFPLTGSANIAFTSFLVPSKLCEGSNRLHEGEVGLGKRGLEMLKVI